MRHAGRLPAALLTLVAFALAPPSALAKHSTPRITLTPSTSSAERSGSTTFQPFNLSTFQQLSYAYTRAPGTDLVTGYMTDGYSRWVSYEPQRSLVSAVSNFYGTARISTFGYANDAAGRRTAISRGGAAMGALAGATDAYGYNARSEVTSARRTLGGDEISGFSYDYAYDPIGNRTSATEYDEYGAPLFAEYAANELNQYTRRTVPGYAAVRGEADTNAFVTVNERPVARTGAYFHGGDYADNTLSNLYADLEIYAAINPPGTNVPDTVYAVTSQVFVAKTPEQFTYDADGNMTDDGRFTYAWNADNRMVCASNAEVVVTYAYDHRGRMVRKDIQRRGAETQRVAYTWDNWNIIREALATNNYPLATTDYIWGLDLDGTLQGAGGVGGLLAVVRNDGVFLPAYDANGNITEYVSTNGEVVAHYDYSPFGEQLIASGPLATTFTHRFSTKPWCEDTRLVEYQLRKYRPNIGRWMSRDLIGEISICHLYGTHNNLCLDSYDYLGCYAIAAPFPVMIGIIVIISFVVILPRHPVSPPSNPFIIPPSPPAIVKPIAEPSINPGITLPDDNNVIDVGTGDPSWAKDLSPVKTCREPDGNCQPCPPDSAIWKHRHKDGTVNCHQIRYNQNPRTCECFPQREHVPCP